MDQRHLRAVEDFVELHPHLQDAYEAWRQGEDLLAWVGMLFPDLQDSEEKERYVLMNAMHACKDPHETMDFARNKTGCDALSAEDVATLDAITFYSRMSLDELHRLGI